MILGGQEADTALDTVSKYKKTITKNKITLAAKCFVRNQQSATSVLLLQELQTFLPSHKMI
jgi:hypothetical protein